MTAQSNAPKVVWQGRLAGLYNKLEEALELEAKGCMFLATVVRSCAFGLYADAATVGHVRAFWNLHTARYYADKVVRSLPQPGETILLTGDQCIAIGILFLRQRLWIRPRPNEAIRVFEEGLKKSHIPQDVKVALESGRKKALALFER